MKNLLGGKGANLAEMANIGLPVPPGFTITTEVCTEFYAQRQEAPQGARRRHAQRGRADGEAGRREVRRPVEPAAGLGPLGRARLDARHDGHDPQPRPQRQDGRRPGREVGQRALRLRQLPPLHRHVRRRRARPQAREQRGPRSVRRDPRQEEEGPRREARLRPAGRRAQGAGRRVQGRDQEAPRRSTSPRIPTCSSRAPSRRSFSRGRTTAPISTAASTTSRWSGARRSTSRRWCSATRAPTRPPASASRAIRPAARTCSTASSW